MHEDDDLYARLGVTSDVDDDGLRKAWRNVARRTHPDVGGDRREFEAAREAYEILSDPQRRTVYDRARQGTSSSTNPGAGGADVGSIVGLLVELNRVERLCWALREQRQQARPDQLVDVTSKLAAAETRLAQLYEMFARACASVGLTMFDPRDHVGPSTPDPPGGMGGRGSGRAPDPLQEATAVFEFADGEKVMYRQVNRHGVPIPDAVQARQFHVGPQIVLNSVRPADRWLRVPVPHRTAGGLWVLSGPRWLRLRVFTAIWFGVCATATGVAARTFLTWPPADSWAARLWNEPGRLLVLYALMGCWWPLRLLFTTASRPAQPAVRGLGMGAIVGVFAVLPGPWWPGLLPLMAAAGLGAGLAVLTQKAVELIRLRTAPILTRIRHRLPSRHKR